MVSTWDRWHKAKQDYHPNFERRANWRKKRVGYACEQCGAKRHEERISREGRPYKVALNAAHVNHDPHKRDAKLIILCQVCHLRYDRDDHADKASRTYHRKNREAQVANGQLVGIWYEKKPRKKN